jgi:hypothetical protein
MVKALDRFFPLNPFATKNHKSAKGTSMSISALVNILSPRKTPARTTVFLSAEWNILKK